MVMENNGDGVVESPMEARHSSRYGRANIIILTPATNIGEMEQSKCRNHLCRPIEFMEGSIQQLMVPDSRSKARSKRIRPERAIALSL